MSFFTLVWGNLFQKKLRSFLMMAAIFIAFLIYAVLGAFNEAFYANESASAAGRLVVANKINFTQPLPFAYLERIRAVDGVVLATKQDWFGGYYKDPRDQIVMFAVEPETYVALYPEYLMPPEQVQAFMTDRLGIMVGQELATKYGWKIGDRVSIYSNIYSNKNGSRSWEFNVAAIFKGKNEQTPANFVLFNADYFNETKAFGRDYTGLVVLKTRSIAENDRIAKEIDNLFANSPFETATTSEQAFNKNFIAQLGNIALIIVLVTGAAFATILMIVGNTMAMAVRERTREIGVLKALGFPGPRILTLILSESVLLALMGGLPGVAAAALIVAGLKKSLSTVVPGLVVTPDIMVTAIVMMIGLGLITGIAPALNAMRLQIVTALGRI